MNPASAPVLTQREPQRPALRTPRIDAPHGRPPIAWWQGKPVPRALFAQHVQQAAAALPDGRYALNLCEDRYAFMVAFVAALLRGQVNLLPADRAPRTLAGLLAAYSGSYRLVDASAPQPRSGRTHRLVFGGRAIGEHGVGAWEHIADDTLAALVFTSGSTGAPQAHAKSWGALRAGSALTAARFGLHRAAPLALVATVPPQHMYGLECSILWPLFAAASVHAGRPFFPADIAQALAAVPAPRVLITTPVHLRACVEAGLPWPALSWPSLSWIISATAPLSADLAQRAERTFAAPVYEIYGCTETGALATRRTLDGPSWQPYDGIVLREDADRWQAELPYLPAPVVLPDRLATQPDGDFLLLDRHSDMVNIAGRRSSLTALTRSLLDIEGVCDGVFVNAADTADGPVERLAALVVAPTRPLAEIRRELRTRIDAVFLPRPLLRVAALPRSATGKLPRAAVLQLLRETTCR